MSVLSIFILMFLFLIVAQIGLAVWPITLAVIAGGIWLVIVGYATLIAFLLFGPLGGLCAFATGLYVPMWLWDEYKKRSRYNV